MRGYTPAILCLHPTAVIPEIVKVYKEQIATRALQRLLSARAPYKILPSVLKTDTRILYFYRSPKQRDLVEWSPGTVVSAEPHLVRIRNLSGSLSCVEYEDIWISPTSLFTRSLMEGDDEHIPTMPEGGIMTIPRIIQILRTQIHPQALQRSCTRLFPSPMTRPHRDGCCH